MTDHTTPYEVLTGRLVLRPVSPDDLDELYAITSDPAGWRHLPEGRHAVPATTREWIGRAVTRWEDGLSYWTARLRADGTLVGVGGVQLTGRGFWNLYYRLATDHEGRGYATELGRAGLAAANRHSPQLPVVARIHAHNQGSRRVAGRLGLIDHGLRLDPFHLDQLHQYADRELPDSR